MADAHEVALDILGWAREHNALANDMAVPALPPEAQGSDVFPDLPAGAPGADDVEKTVKILERVKIVTVLADNELKRATVLTKNQISAAALKTLPTDIDGVAISYIGSAAIEPNPPALPFSSADAAPRTFLHNNRLACGTSVTVAPIHHAGTFGALVRLDDGTLCGLTNNHVTGGCNHSKLGMHVLCPAPHDADPTHVPPTAIGRHHSFVQLESGDPGQVRLQELDVALFQITMENAVTSMQGAGDRAYDTPTDTAAPVGGMMVKKFGRTTGLTVGQVVGRAVTGLGIPFQGDRFNSMVYFDGAWAIAPLAGAFSLGGDSGSLVVTEDGTKAVGLIFAGSTSGEVSFMIPIDSVLSALGAQLVSGYGTT